MIFHTLSQLGYESQKYVIAQAKRERGKILIMIFIQQMKFPGLQNLPAEQTINYTFGGSISPRIISQPMRYEEMLELAHVHIRMGAGEERYMEVLSENFDLNIHYTTHTLTANTHLYLSIPLYKL